MADDRKGLEGRTQKNAREESLFLLNKYLLFFLRFFPPSDFAMSGLLK